MRLIQFDDQITRARILTCKNEHCLLLDINTGDPVLVKSGFTSGYGGEGPRGFSYVLHLLNSYHVGIDEYRITKGFLTRVEMSGLTQADLNRIDRLRPIRPSRWADYIFDKDYDLAREGTIWREFPCVVPYAIVDPRIADIAQTFWQDPDQKLLTGYRRLEDIVRDRTGINQHGAKLFSEAFLGSTPRLIWGDLDKSEQAGRATLFTGAYQAFRNPRAHRELQPDRSDFLTEFLLVNHLFVLERKAIIANHSDPQEAS